MLPATEKMLLQKAARVDAITQERDALWLEREALVAERDLFRDRWVAAATEVDNLSAEISRLKREQVAPGLTIVEQSSIVVASVDDIVLYAGGRR